MSSFSVARSALIPASAEEIFPLVNSFREWTKWSPWENIDPSMQRTYNGPVTGVGAQYAWKGNGKAGAGTMEIVEADEPAKIGIRLEFTKPMKAVNPTTFTFAPEGAGTRVTWSMTGESKGINRVFMLFMNMDKLVGGDFEKGLAALGKAVGEQA
ncbi:transcriptional regulator [Arthrobacter sp. ERGS1:01]|uniref:SRPBCC family protein n=1 Tax=Arthrobacter sp. ERGS1:01 TaxID=1704044 RepID=UPI0006B55980|nr:SRPBCC family protein [Arthrobacter sp. ERGS1:01]ALE06355.1 transcriptional regulator [Arthrobacter sp. ERGS1:01]